jgi:hypothetical protein
MLVHVVSGKALALVSKQQSETAEAATTTRERLGIRMISDMPATH